ncbi:ATP-dependent zinc metalloprotease FtsH [Caniella muris]|uniref:ATP-dependent zinc metalloprotease FtsH n=1 Tax=Caniella muris TaxID=2941502 RepID=UPI0020419E4A|nr:ATP-dependent zinc metalloprotease FtsH [Caniella muris]
MADQKPTGRPTGPSGKGPGPSRSSLLYVLILVACAAYLFWSMGGTGQPQGTQVTGDAAGQSQQAAPKNGGRLSTSEFVAAVDSGRVKAATWSSSSGTVTGTYWTEQDKVGSDADLVSFTSSYAGADSLEELMAAHPDTDFTVDTSDAGAGMDFLFALLPTVIIIVFMFYFMNRMQGQNSGAMQFGKTKAKTTEETRPTVKFSDVAGIDEAVAEIREIRDFLVNPERFQRMGAKIPHGVLLMGPPGTGKTLLAKAVAGEAQVPFFSISGSDFVEMFVGVGASRVRDLFKQAKAAAPAIVFIDEIDAVGRQRGAGLGGGHDEREQTLNQLLVEMDGFEGNATVILIAATNRPDVLDPALLRPGRFDRQITVDRPDVKGREKILQVHSANKPLEPDVEYGALAKLTPGFTGADLANLMNEAALLAARRDKDAIGMEEIEEAMERVIAGPERKSRVVSELERTTIAFHEAGHALVGHYLSNADPVHKITIVPRGQALGYTLSLPEEDHFLQTRNAMFEQIAVLLGGRTAEELFCEDITTGASNDLERATKLARQMVTRYGMSKVLGTQVFGEAQHEVFLGRDYADKQDYSPETALRIDGEVSRIMRQAHEKAKAILEEHADQIRTMAGVLLERETVEGEAVQALLDDTWDEYLAAHPEEKANEEAAEVGHVVAPAGDATGDGGLDELGSEEAHESEEELDHELDPKDPKSPEDPED